MSVPCDSTTVYPKKYAHGFCFAVLCCGYTLTDFPISIRLTSLALWQSNDCPSASKVTLMNMDEYFMWIRYQRLHNHNKAKHNKTVCIFLGIYCTWQWGRLAKVPSMCWKARCHSMEFIGIYCVNLQSYNPLFLAFQNKVQSLCIAYNILVLSCWSFISHAWIWCGWSRPLWGSLEMCFLQTRFRFTESFISKTLERDWGAIPIQLIQALIFQSPQSDHTPL